MNPEGNFLLAAPMRRRQPFYVALSPSLPFPLFSAPATTPSEFDLIRPTGDTTATMLSKKPEFPDPNANLDIALPRLSMEKKLPVNPMGSTQKADDCQSGVCLGHLAEISPPLFLPSSLPSHCHCNNSGGRSARGAGAPLPQRRENRRWL